MTKTVKLGRHEVEYYACRSLIRDGDAELMKIFYWRCVHCGSIFTTAESGVRLVVVEVQEPAKCHG